MGKGNRTRNEKAASVLASSAKKKSNARKGQMPTWVGTLILVAVLVVIVTFAVISVLAQRGAFLRMKLIAETENFEVTVPMMSYMVYTEYQSWVSQYQDSGFMQYIKGSGGSSLNTSLPLRDQIYSQPTTDKPETPTRTWFDYFAEGAVDSVVQILTLCEQAHALGLHFNRFLYVCQYIIDVFEPKRLCFVGLFETFSTCSSNGGHQGAAI